MSSERIVSLQFVFKIGAVRRVGWQFSICRVSMTFYDQERYQMDCIGGENER